MEDLPNTSRAGSGAFSFDTPARGAPVSIGPDTLAGILDAVSDRLAQTLFLVSAQGTILMSAGDTHFDRSKEADGQRWTALWPRESRPLAQEALQAAAQNARELVIEVARMPDGRSAQNWEARITPLPAPANDVVEDGPAHDPLLLVTLRDITAETRVKGLKSR